MHLMYLKGPLCYSVPKRHFLKHVQYVCMYSVCKKNIEKVQPLSQSDELKTKMKLFYLFFYCSEIQRETVARKRCNLTLNLCTNKYYLCTTFEKAHKDTIQGFGPDLSETFTK